MKVICKKVKMLKGKEKREFAFIEETGDKNAVRFEVVPKINEGEIVIAEVKRLEHGNHAYMLQAL